MKKHIIIIAGSRYIKENANNYNIVEHYVDRCLSNLDQSEVIIVSGGARGIDHLGEHYAHKHNLECWRCPAEWHKFGKMAGPIRNAKMAEVATHLIAFPSDASRGTYDMIQKAKQCNLAVRVIDHFNSRNK